MIVLRESTLQTSETYTTMNSTLDITKRAVELIKTAKHLTNEDIEAAYVAVKQITDTLTREALKAFDDERIVFVYNNVAAKSITTAIPFLTFLNKARGVYVTYVFCDSYIKMTRDGVTQIQPAVFRDLLCGAWVANGIKRNYETMASNQFIMKTVMEIYGKLFTRILNREYSFMADKRLYDTIIYYVNRFFLTNVFNAQDTADNIEILAASSIRFLDEASISEIKIQYDNAAPSNLSGLLKLISQVATRLNAANISTFLNDWVDYYYAPSMLAVDNIEYLMFMILTLLSGNNIISISAGDIVKDAKNIKNLKPELLKITEG